MRKWSTCLLFGLLHKKLCLKRFLEGIIGSFSTYTLLKCTLVQALRLCTGRTAHTGSRGIAYSFLTTALEGVRVQRHAPAALYSRKDSLPVVLDAGWSSGPVWRGAVNLAPTGIRSLDRPARSQSLYRLHYPAHLL